MNWFKKNTEPVTRELSFPEGYEFRFKVTERNIPHDLWLDVMLFEISWQVFYNNRAVDSGRHTFRMDEDRLEQQVFLFGRKKARDAKKRADADSAFPFDSNATYIVDKSMVIDGDLQKSYYYYE